MLFPAVLAKDMDCSCCPVKATDNCNLDNLHSIELLIFPEGVTTKSESKEREVARETLFEIFLWLEKFPTKEFLPSRHQSFF